MTTPVASTPAVPALNSLPLQDRWFFRALIRLTHGRHAAIVLWNTAVQKGNRALADRLLGAGVMYPAPDKGASYDGRSELLFEAVRHLDAGALVARVLATGANPNYVHRNDYYDAPTHRAARARNLPAFRALMAAGGDPALRDGNDYTPALAALSSFGAMTVGYSGKPAGTVEDRWAMVEVALAKGAALNAATRHGETLLSYALEDTPARAQWLVDQGATLADPREALEDMVFTSLVDLGKNHNEMEDSLAYDRFLEDNTFRFDRAGMLTLIERLGGTYTGANEDGRTLFEEGLHRARLRPEDVADLVTRGVALEVTDAAGNTLTHQLLTQRSYANEKGPALLDALRQAGLPDQSAVRNTAGQTPWEARDAVAQDWYVREAQAFGAPPVAISLAKA